MTPQPPIGNDSDDEGESDDFARMLELTHDGRAALAEGNARLAVELLSEKHRLVVAYWGSSTIFSATSAVDLAEAHLGCGNTAEADQLLEWALDRYRALQVDDDRFVRALSAHAMSAYLAADYGHAELRFVDLIERYRALGTERDVERAMMMDHLAQVYLRQSKFETAEPMLVAALSIFESHDIDPSIIAVCQSMLARVRFLTGRYREAEQLQRNAIASYEGSDDELHLAKELDHLGATLVMRAQSEERPELAQEAVTHGERAVAIFERYLPADHNSVLGSKQNLAKYKEASVSIGMFWSNKAVEASESSEPKLPESHPAIVTQLVDRSQQLCASHEYGEALACAQEARRRAAQIARKPGALDRYALVQIIAVLRRNCSYLLGEPTGMLSPIENLTMQMRGHARRGIVDDENTPPPMIEPGSKGKISELLREAVALVREASGFARSMLGQEESDGLASDSLEILHYARWLSLIENDVAVRSAFDVIQLHSARGAAEALATAARQTEKTNVWRATREEYRLAVLERDSLVRALVEAKDRLSAGSAAARSGEVSALEQRISVLEDQLREGSNSSSLASRLALDEARAALGHAEAIVAIYVGGRAVFLVAVRSKGMVFRRVEMEGSLVRAMCDSIVESATLPPGEEIPDFDLVSALRLNDLLFHPLREFLEPNSHLLVLANGPLLALPMGCLVTGSVEDVEDQEYSKPAEAGKGAENDEMSSFEGTARRLFGFNKWLHSRTLNDALSTITERGGWLADRYRISLMPSFAPLAARRLERRTHTFLGIGNPDLGPAQANYPEIPETGRILADLADAFGGDPINDIVFGSAATIDRVIELSESGQLADRSVLCFATHAVYPRGDDDLLADAGLLLANGEVLMAFDIAGLRIDADFVLLPACFTASPSGRSISVPLSGLAQSFLTAGARRLLVSHWPVEVGATQKFIGVFASALGNDVSLVDALAQAEQHLRKSPEYVHPAFWAGFSLIGDGAAKLGKGAKSRSE
jgi:tetratricopeptide (TPR) repeat protein